MQVWLEREKEFALFCKKELFSSWFQMWREKKTRSKTAAAF